MRYFLKFFFILFFSVQTILAQNNGFGLPGGSTDPNAPENPSSPSSDEGTYNFNNKNTQCQGLPNEGDTNQCLANYCYSLKNKDEFNDCNIKRCSVRKNEKLRKECRYNFASTELSDDLDNNKISTLSTVSTVLTFFTLAVTIANLIVDIVAWGLRNVSSQGAKSCTAASYLISFAASIAGTLIELAKTIYIIVEYKKLIDEYKNDRILFGLIKPKGNDKDESDGSDPRDLQRRVFRYILAQNKISLTAFRIRMAGAWTQAALYWASVAVAIVEQVAVANNSPNAIQYICKFGLKDKEDKKSSPNKIFQLLGKAKGLVSFLEVLFPPAYAIAGLNSDTNARDINIKSYESDGNTREATRDLFGSAYIAVMLVKTVFKVIAIIWMFKDKSWTKVNTDKKSKKDLIYPITRIVFYTVTAAVTTAQAGIFTAIMKEIEKRNKVIANYINQFDKHSKGSIGIDYQNLQNQEGQEEDGLQGEKTEEEKNQVYNFITDSLMEEAMASDKTSPPDLQKAYDYFSNYKICALNDTSVDLTCQCKRNKTCYDKKIDPTKYKFLSSKSFKWSYNTTINLLNGKQSPYFIDPILAYKSARNAEKMANFIREKANKGPLRKNPLPTFDSMVKKYLTKYINENINQEVVDAYGIAEATANPKLDLFNFSDEEISLMANKSGEEIQKMIVKPEELEEKFPSRNISSVAQTPEQKQEEKDFLMSIDYDYEDDYHDFSDAQDNIFKIISNRYLKTMFYTP